MRQRAAGQAPETVLRQVFDFPAFRPLQAEIVAHVLAGGDALVIMPTGGGKSLCYQVPALCRSGTALVISPLIALMEDQVAALRELGVAAGALHSELDPAEARSVTRDLIEQRLDLLYISPERLLASACSTGCHAFVSHCWRSMRPTVSLNGAMNSARSTRALACLAERFPGVPRLALTATADP